MMRIASVCGVLAVGLTTSGAAQVLKYVDWGEGPVRHLMTREDLKAWHALRSDAEAEAFIDLFWARRDPTPNTIRNEFRDEFDERVRIADDNFSSGRGRGAMSDPGRALILLGPPYRISGNAGQASASMFAAPTDSQGGVVVARPASDPNKQYWMYAHERKPKFLRVSDFTLVFADEGQNEWKLAITERMNPEMILQQAVSALVISPALTRIPVYQSPAVLRTTSFKSSEVKQAYEQLRAADKETFGPANVTWGEFVTTDGEHFVSAQLYVPAGREIVAGQKVTSFAVIENKDGEIVDIRENETTLVPAGTDAYVEHSIQLDPGTFAATFGIASAGHLLAASRTPVTIEGLDPKAAGVSPLLLASSVYPLKTRAQPMDPFTFGGLKVVPKGDSLFRPSGDLWYFVELRNPGVTDVGTPNVRVQVDIAGTTPKGPVALNLPLKDVSLAKLAGEPHRYGLGLAIPLEGFIAGDYTMKVHVVDVVLGKEYDLQKPFRIRG